MAITGILLDGPNKKIVAETTTTPTTPDAGNVVVFADSADGDKLKMVDSTATVTDLSAGGTGEENTASNVGVAGEGLFKQKTGDDLEFRNINAASSKISVALDAGNNEVDVDVVEANLTLTNIGGTLTIAKGGTGQTAKTAAFDALSPTTTKGDEGINNGSANVRLAVGTDGQYKVADSSESLGVRWIDFAAFPAQGRLSLTSATPVTTTDVTGTTLYYALYKGDKIKLYNTTLSAWFTHTFAERSIDNSGLSVDTNYDVFMYDNVGTLTLELLAWSTATARATALVYQDGILCKTGALDRRYLGTVRTWDNAATPTFADVGGAGTTIVRRYVWNYYNRVVRPMYRNAATDTWTWATGSWQLWENANADSMFRVLVGVDEDSISAQLVANTDTTTTGVGRISIALDVTAIGKVAAIISGATKSSTAIFDELVGIGYHEIRFLEYGAAAFVQRGDNGAPTNNQAGAVGSMLA